MVVNYSVWFLVFRQKSFVSKHSMLLISSVEYGAVEFAHCFPACLMSRLKECPDGRCPDLFRDSGPKRCHHSQTSRTQSPLNPLYIWCNMMLTGLHHSSQPAFPSSSPQILSYSPFTSHLFFSHLTCTRVRGNHNNNNFL